MTTPSIETGMGIRAESISARPPTPQIPSGFITAKSIPENLCRSAIGPSFTKIHSTGRRGVVSSSYSQSRLGSMLGVAGQQVERMWQQRQDGAQAVLRTCWAAGKVDNECPACDAADAAAKCRKWCLPGAVKTDLLGDARHEAAADCKSGLGSHVTLRQACATCR